MELTGAEIIIRCLQEEQVEYAFGYPGGAVLFIYDELFKQDKLKHVLVRHEQAAVHAADGYARSSDKVGVAIVTSGPGLTNAVTGIATAYMDSIPMVIISVLLGAAFNVSNPKGIPFFQKSFVSAAVSCSSYGNVAHAVMNAES